MHFLVINNGSKWTEGLGLTVNVKKTQQQPNNKKYKRMLTLIFPILSRNCISTLEFDYVKGIPCLRGLLL